MATRKSARIALRSSITYQDGSTEQQDELGSDPWSTPSREMSDDTADDETRPTKLRKTATTSAKSKSTPASRPRQIPPTTTAPLPKEHLAAPFRNHPQSYHQDPLIHPTLLTSRTTRDALLTWFTSALSNRSMPWRKPFLPAPSTSKVSASFRTALAKRAYEVWISEVMLQQTRVATVVDYWTRWMARWPTIQDLAQATEEEVLAQWRGLGYYARARRVWEAARWVCKQDEEGDGEGLMPCDVEGLMRVPGVGRYTAGAIAAIVFGVAAPMVDGNVLRVLSRQLGVLGDVKGDKKVIQLIWDVADQLAKNVAADGGDEEASDRPGRWGQALMELGSTVCTPKPNCAACPITETCRAYAEGLALAEKRPLAGMVGDIEDLCTLCAPLEEAAEEADAAAVEEPRTTRGDSKLSRFFAPTGSAKETGPEPSKPDPQTLGIIVNHARKFPLKKPKKEIREEETVVCAIRRPSDGQYLIQRRPAKGLLANLWELPSLVLPASNDSILRARRVKAQRFFMDHLVVSNRGDNVPSTWEYLGEIDSVPWLFSHLKLTMHIHAFEIENEVTVLDAQKRWANPDEIDAESMGTGMRKCWALVKKYYEGEAKKATSTAIS
ncbi:A/G-specific adenine DNA glycosylase [Dichotomopilus funicola]|uniref:Adenine DNA glycosylase n=1 Tax=Dichotomopilus funicola TaxID=1934379 RepID=A0AAN6ZKZ2_9PEZI|nr:A/G-specific adenine DNA glycosylase [Dichotomopilus funicola]